MAYSPPYQYLGLVVSGDLGPCTIYTSRRWKKVFFPRSPPLRPPSAAQLQWRRTLTTAMWYYANLTQEHKQKLADCTKKLSLCMTPQALWYSLSVQRTDDRRQTLMHQSGISLPNPYDHAP